MGKEDGDNERAGFRCWMLDIGYSMLVSGHWSLVAGILNSELDLLLNYFFVLIFLNSIILLGFSQWIFVVAIVTAKCSYS